MKRRRFIELVGGAAVAWPLAAQAEQSMKPQRRELVAVLFSTAEANNVARQRELLEDLQHLGHYGEKLSFAYRYADGNVTAMLSLAQEIVKLRPDVIVTGSVPATLAAKSATITIPIVCASLGEPVSLGLVESYAHPGGNVTGVASFLEGMATKRLQLIREIFPNTVRIGLLINPDNPFVVFQARETVAAAQEMKIEIISAEASSPDQVEGAFNQFERQNVQIGIVPLDQMFLQERTQILALAVAARLPTIAAWPDDAVDGYLMSYGVSLRESYRQVAGYVARILEGTKASDLPVDFPAKVDLVVNLRTAKILGITIPPNLLVQATAVIE